MDKRESRRLCSNFNIDEHGTKMVDDKDYRDLEINPIGAGLLNEKYGSGKPKTGTAKKLAVAGGFLGLGYMIFPHPYIAALQIVASALKGIFE